MASGNATLPDPLHFETDPESAPDPDPALFVGDFQDTLFFYICFAYFFL
jgi:hypothetical protein